ncbi:MAG TPA: PaaI family thioesterase [Candidatus Dormibacteraeota bacterium]|nr:PaaI family thioesterase [Candidatus Dormibacteraeota bacterium]
MTTIEPFDLGLPEAARRLGFSKIRLEDGGVSLSGALDAACDADPSTIHALSAALLDSVCDGAFRSLLVDGDRPSIIELTLRFARPFTSENGVLTCRAHVVDLGEHVGTARAEIADAAGCVFVEADATCVIRRP